MFKTFIIFIITTVLFFHRAHSAPDIVPDLGEIVDNFIENVGEKVGDVEDNVDKFTSKIASAVDHATSNFVGNVNGIFSAGESIADRIKSDFEEGRNGDDDDNKADDDDNKTDDDSGAYRPVAVYVPDVAAPRGCYYCTSAVFAAAAAVAFVIG